MNKPHVHADLIKAWADGATIQFKLRHVGGRYEWVDCGKDMPPNWLPQTEYRLKPTKVTRWLWAYKNSSNLWRISTRYLTDQEATMFYSKREKLDFSEMEFDE